MLRKIFIVALLLACLPARAQNAETLDDLMREIQQGLTDQVGQLLTAHPDFVNAETKKGLHPLYEAVYMGRPEIANLLISRGADVNAPTARHTTALHAAAGMSASEFTAAGLGVIQLAPTSGHAKIPFELATLLLANGAQVDPLDNEHRTPLHWAVEAGDGRNGAVGNGAVAALLLEKGANVNMVDGRGLTPLHLAARRGGLQMVKLLLDKGAAVNPVSPEGLTPLALCERYKLRDWKKVVELLTSKGGLEVAPGQE